MRYRLIRTLLLFVVAVSLQGCGGSSPAPATATPESTPPVPLGGAPAAAVMLVYAVHSGPTGIDQQLRIAAGGRAVLTQHGAVQGAVQLGRPRLELLTGELDRLDFFHLSASYDAGPNPTGIYTTITYTQRGQTRTVRVADVDNPSTPAGLRDLITELRTLAAVVGSAVPGATVPPDLTPLPAGPPTP